MAAAQAEADRLAREEAERVAEAERQAAREAARPDAEKLVAYAEALRAVPIPDMTTNKGADILSGMLRWVGQAREFATDFDAETKGESF